MQFDVLVKFVQILVIIIGMLLEVDVVVLCNVGFSDQQVIEIISVISVILFINMVNWVNDMVVDFLKVD